MIIPDSIISYLLCAADAAAIIPGAVICLLPVRKWSSISTRYLFLIAIAISLLFSLVVPFLGYGTTVNGNVFVLPFLAVAFLLYICVIRLSKPKLIYLFLCTTASLSYGGLINYLVIDYTHPKSADSIHWEGVLVQWVIEFLLLMFFLWLRPRLEWLLENFDESGAWIIFALLPAVITVLNIMMIPQNPEIMTQGRLFQLSLIIEMILLAFFLMYQVVFCEIAKVFQERFERDKMSQLLEEQSIQYQSLQNYMDQTDRLMHDMRQVIRTIRQLAQEGKLTELDKLAQEYESTTLSIPTPELFCEHVSLNAMLGYYAGLARQQQIAMRWKIKVPAEIKISDVEICTLFGNLLENAFNACHNVPPEERYIHLSADTDTPGCLYIVMVNSTAAPSSKGKRTAKATQSAYYKADCTAYDCADDTIGEAADSADMGIKSRQGLPKRVFHKNGIGTSSIKSTAEKYGGTAEFSTRDNEFHSHVMMQV